MKTLIIKLSKLIFLLPLFLFAGCEKEKIADLELSETKLSNLSASIGIDTITRLENDNTSTNYKINGRKIIINDFEVNLKEANFKIEKVGDDFNITLDLKSKGSKIIVNYYIFHSQKKIFKRVNGRLVAIENLINQKREETLVFVAMSIFNELVNNNSHKLTKRVNSGNQLKAQYIDEGATCSRTIASLRSSRSSAVAHATTATDDFIKLHPDCSKVNGVDAGCIWGDYGCIATQEISCTGGGCSAPFGQL